MFWTMHSGILAAIAMVFARYAGYLRARSTSPARAWWRSSAIVVLSAINYVGVTFGGRVQSAFTLVKVLAVMAIIVLGFALMSWRAADRGRASLPPVTLANFLLAVGAGLFAFGGWHMVTYTAEETVDPTRTIPRSLMIGIVDRDGRATSGSTRCICACCRSTSVMSSSRVAADTFEVLIGPGAAGAISALVMFSASAR